MGFAALPDLQYALSQQTSGDFTTTSVNTDLHNVKNFQSFLGPVDTCDHTQWPGTSSCNHQVLMLKVKPARTAALTRGRAFLRAGSYRSTPACSRSRASSTRYRRRRAQGQSVPVGSGPGAPSMPCFK